MTSAVTREAALIQTAAESLFTLLCGDMDRGAVTGEGKMGRGYQPAFNGPADGIA